MKNPETEDARAAWLDEPLAQWIYIKHEPQRHAAWCLIVAGFVRACFSTREAALQCESRLRAVLLAVKPVGGGS